MKSVNIKLIYVFLILCRPLLCWASIDYCSLCENGFHTMCLYPRDGPGPSCLDYRKVEFTQYQKMYIVDIHNDIRNHVASGLETKGKLGNQPPATNMLQLEWSDELAKIAQRWADQCIPVNATKQHDTCKTTSQFDNVGQNILTAVTNGTDVSELAILILNWYKQVVNVIPSDIDHFEGIKRGQFLIGQYTQLVWANTKAVGCGMSIYKDSPRGFYNQRLVCNYGPGGNIIGQPVYLQGIPCTGCPKGRCNNIRKYLCESLVTENSTNQSKDDNPFPDQNFNNNVISCLLKLEFSEENLYKCKNLTNRNTTDYPTETATVYNNFLTENNGTFMSSISIIQNISKINWLFNNEVTVINFINEEEKFDEIDTTSQFWLNPEVNVRFKRAVGRWYNGECKCDKIYRSPSNLAVLATYLIDFCLVIILYIR